MANGLIIRFIGGKAADIHRNRNFAEDLHVQLAQRKLAITSDPDVVTNEFTIERISKRQLGSVQKIFRNLVAKHRMKKDVEVEAR